MPEDDKQKSHIATRRSHGHVSNQPLQETRQHAGRVSSRCSALQKKNKKKSEYGMSEF